LDGYYAHHSPHFEDPCDEDGISFQMGYRDGEKAFSLEEKRVIHNQLFVIKTIIYNYDRHK